MLQKSLPAQLATCVNYVDLNNSMLCKHGHVYTGFFPTVTFYFCKVNTVVSVILSQVHKVNLLIGNKF